jgi:hypothetical protein
VATTQSKHSHTVTCIVAEVTALIRLQGLLSLYKQWCMRSCQSSTACQSPNNAHHHLVIVMCITCMSCVDVCGPLASTRLGRPCIDVHKRLFLNESSACWSQSSCLKTLWEMPGSPAPTALPLSTSLRAIRTGAHLSTCSLQQATGQMDIGCFFHSSAMQPWTTIVHDSQCRVLHCCR